MTEARTFVVKSRFDSGGMLYQAKTFKEIRINVIQIRGKNLQIFKVSERVYRVGGVTGWSS